MPLGAPQQDLESKASLLQTVFSRAPSQLPLPWVVSPGVHYFVHDVFLATTQGPRRLRPARVVFVGKRFISPEKPSFPPLSAAFPRQSCVLWFVPAPPPCFHSRWECWGVQGRILIACAVIPQGRLLVCSPQPPCPGRSPQQEGAACPTRGCPAVPWAPLQAWLWKPSSG